LNDVCLAIAGSVAKRNVSTFFWKPGFDIDVAIIINSNMPCAAFHAVNNNDSLKIIRKKKPSVIRITFGQITLYLTGAENDRKKDREEA
jgi:hypothetical protein